MTTPAASPGGGISAQARAAVETFRSVGKWLITAFAAVGSLLIAGLQLTSLGSIHGWRLGLAMGGFALAVVAVIVAILELATLLQPHVSAPDDAARQASDPQTKLGRFVTEHREVLLPPGCGSARDVFDQFAAARVAADKDTPEGRARLAALRGPLASIVSLSSYMAAKERFNAVRNVTIVAALAVAAGAAAYAYAATGPATSTSTAAVPPAPVAVQVKLNPAGSKALAAVLGRRCATAARKGIPAIALSADTSQTTVLLIPKAPACPTPVQFSLPISQGIASPVVSVKPAVSPSAKPGSSH